MSQNNNWFQSFPQWIWYSLTPIFGGASIFYAGWKAKVSKWYMWGAGLLVISLVSYSLSPSFVILLSVIQLGVALNIRREFLIKTAPKGVLIPSPDIAKLMAEDRGQIDINNCTKDDLVYGLGLSIIYANDLQMLRDEGYLFTHLEELTELVGIPSQVLRRIEPLITFTYDINKEIAVSWRRLNECTYEQLIVYGIDQVSAKKIISERNSKGAYKSLLDVRKRTGIPINIYRHLV